MADTAYLHRIEYLRREPNGALTREHEETVQDHGWYLERGDEWKKRYTVGCAEDFLGRVRARPGTYAVVVWREGKRVCTVGFHWTG
jgi:hypothetical protein